MALLILSRTTETHHWHTAEMSVQTASSLPPCEFCLNVSTGLKTVLNILHRCQGCSLGLERLGLETFFESSRCCDLTCCGHPWQVLLYAILRVKIVYIILTFLRYLVQTSIKDERNSGLNLACKMYVQTELIWPHMTKPISNYQYFCRTCHLYLNYDLQTILSMGSQMVGMWRIPNPTESDTFSEIRNPTDS